MPHCEPRVGADIIGVIFPISILIGKYIRSFAVIIGRNLTENFNEFIDETLFNTQNIRNSKEQKLELTVPEYQHEQYEVEYQIYSSKSIGETQNLKHEILILNDMDSWGTGSVISVIKKVVKFISIVDIDKQLWDSDYFSLSYL